MTAAGWLKSLSLMREEKLLAPWPAGASSGSRSRWGSGDFRPLTGNPSLLARGVVAADPSVPEVPRVAHWHPRRGLLWCFIREIVGEAPPET